MLESTDSAELTEWIAYYQIEPWGFNADNFRSAIIAETMANILRDPKKQPEPFKMTDFMINTDPPAPEPPKAETLYEKFKAMFGG